jgi:hypothetical protein
MHSAAQSQAAQTFAERYRRELDNYDATQYTEAQREAEEHAAAQNHSAAAAQNHSAAAQHYPAQNHSAAAQHYPAQQQNHSAAAQQQQQHEAMQHEASRVAHHMRRLAGFAPTTDAHSSAEFHVYSQVVHRVRSWMYAQGITPDTVRGSLHAMNECARAEGAQLYAYATAAAGPLRSQGLAWVLVSPAACQAYVMAIMLSIQGSLSAEAKLQERGRQQRPQWQTRGHPARRHAEDARRGSYGGNHGGSARGRGGHGGRGRGGRGGLNLEHPQREAVAQSSAVHTVSVDASDL